MQSQKISSKLYTARELSNLQRFYRARAFTLSIRAQNFNKNNRFLIENTYINNFKLTELLVSGTMCQCFSTFPRFGLTGALISTSLNI